MTDGARLELRPTTSQDDAFVDSLLLADALAELAAVPEPMRTDLAAMQVSARRCAYAAAFPKAVDQVVLSGGAPIGRLLLDDDGVRVHVVDVRLALDERGRGVGTGVLGRVCDEAARRGLPVTLSARRGSAAEAWYRQFGFTDADDVGDDDLGVALVRRPPASHT